MADTITLSDEFHIDSKLLYEQFLDLRTYGKHHPVMTDVTLVSDNRPEYVEYEVNEIVKVFGLIKIYPNYKAKVFEIKKGQHIQYTSQVKPRVFLVIDIYFSEDNNKTKLTENIQVSANKLITIIFFDILRKAHLGLFKNIKTNLQKT